MKTKLKIIIIGALSIMTLTPTVWYGLKIYWQNKTKNLYSEAQEFYLKKYAYTYIGGYLDQTMYAENIEDGKKLLDYYDQVFAYYKIDESGSSSQIKSYSFITGDSVSREPVAIPISLNYLSVPQLVYIQKDAEEIPLVKAYVFNTHCWGYFIAYIPKYNLHNELPPNSELQELIERIKSLPKKFDSLYGRPSQYGFYCN
ncbi:MAG TPA: hypothetical protein PKM97_03725 [Bacteroidia bacterium]|nr:hypothetical protein [Bacteroidia bacterium]